MALRKEPRQRIFDNMTIDDNGCWLMNARKSKGGYAETTWKENNVRKRMSAHRYSYQAFNGEIPQGLDVCHTCDVKNCVNPEHLWVGTHQDNMSDMVKKGRAAPGKGRRKGWRKYPIA